MNYKTFVLDCDEKSMDFFHSSIIDDLSVPYINNPDTIIESELSLEQLLNLINSEIYKVYKPNKSNIEDMFELNFKLYKENALDVTINAMIELLRKEELSIEDIRKFHYPEFVCYVLLNFSEMKSILLDAQKEGNEINEREIIEIDKMICKAIEIYIQLLYVDNEIISLVRYVTNLFHPCNHNYDIISTSIPIIGYLFKSNYEDAQNIINDQQLIDQIFSIAKSSNISLIQCSHAIKLISTMIYYSINSDIIFQLMQMKSFEKFIIKSFYYLKSSILNVTDKTLKLFQIITTNIDMYNFAKEFGLEKVLSESLDILNDSQKIEVFKIIRNILLFVKEGKIQTKIVKYQNFYTRTAELIMKKNDDEALDVLFSTIDLLGIVYWEQLLRLGVCASLIEITKNCNFSTQKRICSLLLNIFNSGDVSFRREFCNFEILDTFMKMLDDEDDAQFCIELITNLSLILSSDDDFFHPIFEQFEYEQHLEDLAENSNEELAGLAQATLNSFNGK